MTIDHESPIKEEKLKPQIPISISGIMKFFKRLSKKRQEENIKKIELYEQTVQDYKQDQ